MGIWSNSPKAEKAPKEPRAEKRTTDPKTAPAGQGSTWTGGRALGAQIVGGILLVGLISGPAALALTLTRGPAVAAADTSAQSAGLTALEQSTGSYALAYTAAWLAASRGNDAELKTYVDTSGIQLTEAPWEYRDAAVVSIAPATAGNITTVVVAANVKEMAASTVDDGTTESWPRRYFQVAVTSDPETGNLGVVGLPAPVAAPVQVEKAPTLVYGSQLAPDSAASTAVTAFLGAYLAGSGDITRYIAPSTEISAITPAPYVTLDATDLRVDVEPSEQPADGDTARVLATVVLTNALEQTLTSTYALTITARADRWEVTSIDPAPQEKPSTEGASTTPAPAVPTPSPTGDTTEGN